MILKDISLKYLLTLILMVSGLMYIDNMILNILVLIIMCGMIIFTINKFDIEKMLIMFFFLFIPFLRDYDFSTIGDFHTVTKPYYTFNFMHIFSIIFLCIILKNISKIEIGGDIILLAIFNIVCICSGFYAMNSSASYFDAFRILNISILYVYFSRVFDYKKYKCLVMKILILTVTIQFLIGILQILIGGPIGLGILGESKDVFRAGVSGFEKGMSGTFGHPGPFALYSLIVISFIMFDNELKGIYRKFGVVICTLNICIAAGRTCIALMAIIYIIYGVNSLKNIDTKKIIYTIIIGFIAIIGSILMYEKILALVNRFISSDISAQFENRLYHYEIAFEYIKQKPLLGWGLNNYLDLSYYNHPIRFKTNFFFNNPIHNAYLLYAVEIGIFGSLIFVLFLLNGFKKYKKSKNYLDENIINILKGYLSGILVYSIYNFQGWGGIQTRSLLLIFILNAFIYKIKKSIEYNEDFEIVK